MKYKSSEEWIDAMDKAEAYFSENPEIERMYEAFRFRLMKEMWGSMEPELRRLHDLAITAYNAH